MVGINQSIFMLQRFHLTHPTFYRFYFDSYNPKHDRSICSLVGWAKQHWQIIRFKNHCSLPTALPNNNHQHLNNLHFGCWVLLRATQPTSTLNNIFMFLTQLIRAK